MPYVETSIVIAAPASVVYELAKDQERFPQFMPDVESVVILERHPAYVLSRWRSSWKKRRSSGPKKTVSTTNVFASNTNCWKAISTSSKAPGRFPKTAAKRRSFS